METMSTHGYEVEEAAQPRQIPSHLQQPLRPQAQPTRAASRPVEARVTTVAPAPARKSLFGIVTGAIRGHAAEPVAERAEAPAYAEPTRDASRDRAPPAAAQVRQAGAEEIGIEIPAFLRRQS